MNIYVFIRNLISLEIMILYFDLNKFNAIIKITLREG